MSDTKEFTITNEEGEEYRISLPVRFEVCERCEGNGTHLHPAIGDHAYTAEQFMEEFDEEERAEYFRHGGRYDVQCEECHGLRVVSVIDVDRCTTAEQKAALVGRQICTYPIPSAHRSGRVRLPPRAPPTNQPPTTTEDTTMQIYLHDGHGKHGYLVSPATPTDLSPWACEAADFVDLAACEKQMARMGVENCTAEIAGRTTGYAVDVL